MRSLIIFTVITIIACTSFKNKIVNSNSHTNNKNLLKEYFNSDSLPLLDTIIILSGANNSYFNNKNLTKKEAETCLYKYFKSKGVITRDELKSELSESEERLCVYYDTIYKMHTNKFSGAIISYWLGPADLNGHCFQPSKAIIRNTKNGYKITDEEFISTNFAIDSTVKSSIYGYDYECGGRGIIRHFKVTLR
jgi:hypothetical protein